MREEGPKLIFQKMLEELMLTLSFWKKIRISSRQMKGQQLMKFWRTSLQYQGLQDCWGIDKAEGHE